MTKLSGEPQLSWQTIVGAVTVVGLMTVAGWTIFENQIASVKETITADRLQAAHDVAELKTIVGGYLTKDEHKAYTGGVAEQLSGIRLRLVGLESGLASLQPRLAHDPVEDRTFQSVVAALGKQIDQIQAQITDINRQIAAALIIIDNNAGAIKKTPALPP